MRLIEIIDLEKDRVAIALASHSPDPSDPSVTERVITIMLAEEY
jgi:hypothetical protein